VKAPRKPKPAKPILSRAERNIAWCETHIRIPEGKFVGQPLKMAEFMREDFRAIYDNPHGTRRAIISRGRKNAKTTQSAMILLLHLVGPEAKPNAQLYSAAQSRDQAAILFGLAAKMVRLSPDLSAHVGIRDTAKQLYCEELGTLYRALSADATTAYGLSPILTIHDELGQVRGPRSALYDALETATAAQESPLTIIISTQAPNDDDLLSVLIDDAQKASDPRTVLRFNTAPPDLDPFSEDAIRAANPAFGVFMNPVEVLAMAEDARRMPSRQAEFENLILNRRVEASDPYVSPSIWAACAAPASPDWRGASVYAGLDLSASADLTAFVRVAWLDGVLHVRPTFWLPSEGLADKSRIDRVPYDLWARQGHLVATPGRTVDYDWVAPVVLTSMRAEGIRQIAFDRWNMRFLRPALERAGATEEEMARFVEFGQGFQSMSPALRALDGVLLNGLLRHGGHPVLTMCAANAVVKSDPAGNRKLVKFAANRRIDGMIALAMAVATAGDPAVGEAVPEPRVLFL
jgi:phage terminase large subunit-like protein